LSLSDYQQALQYGTSVAEGVVCILMREEERLFGERAAALSFDLKEKVLVVRMSDTTWLNAMSTKHGASPLGKEAPEEGKKDGKGFYNSLRDQWELQDPLQKLMVVFGVCGNNHFSPSIWLPRTFELFQFDTFSPCGHATIVAQKYVPLIKHLSTKEDASALEVITKDHTNGIERQPSSPAEDANVCGFATPFIVLKALTSLLELAESGEHDDEVSLAEALSIKLHNMTTEASMYKNRRRLGKQDLVRLAAEYRKHRAAKGDDAAAANTGGPVTKPTAKPVAKAPAAKAPAAKHTAKRTAKPAAKPAGKRMKLASIFAEESNDGVDQAEEAELRMIEGWGNGAGSSLEFSDSNSEPADSD
jgi:hypothetical protein